MSKLRFRVVESAFEKKATELTTPAERPSEYYGELVFNREKMFKYLPERAYERLVDSIDNGTPLDRNTRKVSRREWLARSLSSRTPILRL